MERRRLEVLVHPRRDRPPARRRRSRGPRWPGRCRPPRPSSPGTSGTRTGRCPRSGPTRCRSGRPSGAAGAGSLAAGDVTSGPGDPPVGDGDGAPGPHATTSRPASSTTTGASATSRPKRTAVSRRGHGRTPVAPKRRGSYGRQSRSPAPRLVDADHRDRRRRIVSRPPGAETLCSGISCWRPRPRGPSAAAPGSASSRARPSAHCGGPCSPRGGWVRAWPRDAGPAPDVARPDGEISSGSRSVRLAERDDRSTASSSWTS